MTNSKFTRSSQSGAARIVPVFLILFSAAFAAIAMPQYQDRDRDRDRDFGGIFISREQMVQDFGGGRGGRPSRDAVCDPDSVAVGFHVQTGEYFNEAWLDCVHIRRDGDMGDDVRMTDRTGSRGGRPVYDAFCPNGFALRGLRGRTGASIDVAVGICSPLREIARRDPRPRTEMTQPIARPGAGGHPAEAVCPPGGVVTGFRSNSGEYMDHLWLVCSEVRADRDRDHDRDRNHYR